MLELSSNLKKTKGMAGAWPKLSNIVGQHGQNANLAQILPSLATVSADKFMRRFVAEMFLHAQTFLAHFTFSSMFPKLATILGNNSTQFFQMAEVNMRSVEVSTVHSPKKMTATPRADGVDVEADFPEGESHGTVIQAREEIGKNEVLNIKLFLYHLY